jgi:multisubunit Na+/H+ antiporter MnhC subunit
MFFWILAAVFVVVGVVLVRQSDTESILPGFGVIAFAFALIAVVVAVVDRIWNARRERARGENDAEAG